jgi:uncharacterized protein YidB (DUF937 family)
MASPRLLALLGLLAVAGYQNRDKLQSVLGNITGQNGSTGSGNRSDGGGLGGFLGNLGGLFGGGATAGGLAGGGLSGALGDLLGQFSANGHGETAKTWVETGPNRPVVPGQLEEALGEDTIRELTQKTGLSRQELLSRLSTILPQAVDTLTPQGRLPTRDEETRWAATAGV